MTRSVSNFQRNCRIPSQGLLLYRQRFNRGFSALGTPVVRREALLFPEISGITDNIVESVQKTGSRLRYNRRTTLLVTILLIAGVLRLFQLGQSSLWYDEVVPMRLARTKGPGTLLQLLRKIDATRAPLHPLVLQCWTGVFGPSDCSGRALSVICGVITVGLVYWIGLLAFDARTGLWASWLCAVSPLMVYYSRKRQCISGWFLTCLAWSLLFAIAITPPGLLAIYTLTVIGLVYSHPLGLLMLVALALATWLFHQAFQFAGDCGSFSSSSSFWCPTLGQSVSGTTSESTTGLLPVRYLLGMPIGFVGGNFRFCSFAL